MKVIVIASQKGGAGKTTITSHLAVEAERAGAGPVAVIDTDPQASLAMWWNARQAPTPLFVAPPDGGLGQCLQALEGRGVHLVFIDTPPAIGTAIAAAMAFADLVLIPVRPSPMDLRAIPVTIRLVEAIAKPVLFIINAVKPRVALTGETAIALSEHGTVARQQIADRTAYASATIDGRTAPELDPPGPAAREIAELWSYVALRLQGRTVHGTRAA